jgi:dihydroorotate dehydrogenase
MKLRGIDFGRAWYASGVGGYFGEGYPWHRWLRPFGLDLRAATIVSKTATLKPKKGNLKYKKDGLTPATMFPDCVIVKWRKGVTLNAVGLSNPGLKALLDMNRWQQLTEPFFISLAAVGKTKLERKEEFRGMFDLISKRSSSFRSRFGIQINLSCPNSTPIDFEREAEDILNMACYYLPDLPVVAKFSIVDTTPEQAVRISTSNCDAICVSNSLKWGSFPGHIDWKGLFGSDTSPLDQYGGGGLSGWPLFALTIEWLQDALSYGLSVPFNFGGGIMSAKDVVIPFSIGAESVSIGSVALTSPTQVRSIIKAANKRL